MNDPSRIDRILEKLGRKWKKVPNFRLGELIISINAQAASTIDPFYTEDEVIEKWLDENWKRCSDKGE
jgi:hypothetical protein